MKPSVLAGLAAGAGIPACGIYLRRDTRHGGDALLVNPTSSGTMAGIVNAAPEHIWPSLVQIGYRRGGLYSYDSLGRLFGYLDRPSATRILRSFRTSPSVTRFPSVEAQAGRCSHRAQSRARVRHEEPGRL